MSPAPALIANRPLSFTGPEFCQAPDVVRHLAHELRQPLSAIEATAFYLDIVLPRTDLRSRQQIAKLQQFVDQANWILTDALHYLLAAPPRPELLDLDELVSDCVADLGAGETTLLRLRATAPPALVQLDPGHAQHMVRNLLNVFRLLADGKAVTVSTLAFESSVQMEISCPAGDLNFDPETLFDPFSPHLPPGSGLALASVRRITESHGGIVELSFAGPGVIRATVTLPHPDAE
jgi:signal transduction histidine kinase